MSSEKVGAVAVIGGGYGDEGKGLMTDFYASSMNNPIVVRSNGGAQAGHTVVTPDGKRHVFSHFGSGTFAGAPTFLSEFFVVNPTLFRREHSAFVREFGIEPTVVVDSEAQVTTPYEMLLNQTLEQMRGDNPHGSCGTGFGETLERAKRMRNHHPFTIGWIAEHVGNTKISAYLSAVRQEYVRQRVDPNSVSSVFDSIINSRALVEDYVDDLAYFFQHVEVRDPSYIYDHNLIFEGAQGLLLDQDYGAFPHVTRSNTGMRNVSAILEKIPTRIDQLTVNYVTRAYTTRHGAGPLPFEKDMPEWVRDDTNIHNEWQRGLRYAPLNVSVFDDTADKDFALYGDEHNGKYEVSKVTTVTCVDQLPDNDVEFLDDRNEVFHFHPSIILDGIFPQMFDYMSQGPTRNTIHATTDP